MAAAAAGAAPLLAGPTRAGVPAAAAALPMAARLWGGGSAGFASSADGGRSAHSVAQQVLAANQDDVGPEVIEAVAALEPSVRPSGWGLLPVLDLLPDSVALPDGGAAGWEGVDAAVWAGQWGNSAVGSAGRRSRPGSPRRQAAPGAPSRRGAAWPTARSSPRTACPAALPAGRAQRGARRRRHLHPRRGAAGDAGRRGGARHAAPVGRRHLQRRRVVLGWGGAQQPRALRFGAGAGAPSWLPLERACGLRAVPPAVLACPTSMRLTPRPTTTSADLDCYSISFKDATADVVLERWAGRGGAVWTAVLSRGMAARPSRRSAGGWVLHADMRVGLER